MFLEAKHTITLKRVKLRAKILKIAKSLKSWVYILKITDRALLSGIFINSRFINKALKVLKKENNSNKIIKVARSIRTMLHIG